MSFIQMIIPVNGKHDSYWYKQSVKESMAQSTEIDCIRFVAGQAVTLNYIARIYSGNALRFNPSSMPYYIYEYYLDLCEMAKELREDTLEPEYGDYVKIIKMLLHINDHDGLRMNPEGFIKFLREPSDVPIPCKSSFFTPYLYFIYDTRLLSGTLGDGRWHAERIWNEVVSVPSFFYNGSVLIEEDLPISLKYHYSYVDTQSFGKHPQSCGESSIFSFLRNYDWSAHSSTGVIGLLATYGTLELDPSNLEESTFLRAFYDVHRSMNPTEPSVVSTLTYTPKLGTILHFLVDIFTRFKIKIDSRKALSVFINGNDLDGKLLRDYILANSPDEVSAEAYEAFKRSTLRNLVGLELMNSVDGSVSTSMYSMDAVAHSSLVDAKPKGKEPDPNAEPEETPAEEDPKEDQPKKKTKKEAKPQPATTDQEEPPPNNDDTAESTQTPEEKTDDQPMDQEDQKPTKKDKGVDDAPQEGDEPTQGDDEKPAGSGNTQTQVHTHKIPKPKLPGINLKKGVTLELAQDDEDIDTFLYRKEVGSFIDSVLANPNHLSIQQQEMLKKIKSQFLFTLNVQSLYNLLKSTVS